MAHADPDPAALFARLASAPARHAALDRIVAHLTPADWRHLLRRLQLRSFQFDIVGALPLELAAAVFQHLPVNAPFLYQRVCKRWRHLLSSPPLIRSSLAQWYWDDSDASPKLQGGVRGLCEDPYALNVLKAEHAKRFQDARPYSSRVYQRPSHYPVEFLRDTLGWIEPSGRAVGVCNLRTGERLTVAGDAREEIGCFKLTEHLVAFVTLSGLCYVYELHSKRKAHFRLPNGGTWAFTGCGNTIAVGTGTSAHGRESVFTWNFVDQRTRSFDFELPRMGHPFSNALTVPGLGMPDCVILDERTRSLVIFFVLNAPADSSYVEEAGSWLGFKRFSLDGTILEDTTCGIFVPIRVMAAGTVHPMDYEGRFYHVKYILVSDGYHYSNKMAVVIFDNHLNRLLVKTTDDELAAFRTEDLDRTPPYEAFEIFLWKTALYFTAPPGGYDGPESTAHGPQTYQAWEKHRRHGGKMDNPDGLEVCVNDDAGEDAGGDAGDDILMGNEHFMLLFRQDHCIVWCFDEHIELPAAI